MDSPSRITISVTICSQSPLDRPIAYRERGPPLMSRALAHVAVRPPAAEGGRGPRRASEARAPAQCTAAAAKEKLRQGAQSIEQLLDF